MRKVLISNRGEIAVRVVRACRDYGVQSVAVYADPDIDAPYVRMADEAYALDGTRPGDTYLHIEKLIAVARRCGADAVHPGYGFLSENAAFAQAVLDAGLVWIGPSPAAISRLGDKVQARQIALRVGAPLVAGTPAPVKDVGEVIAFAREHGLPIAIKAAFGGGGRGIKVARNLQDIEELYESAVREAVAAFGRGECFVEKFLDCPRHIEAQVIADNQGHVVVLGTRDCSLQRRNQKLVEEAPAPFLSAAQHETVVSAARNICVEAGYTSAGTVEFLLGADGALSFLEVNTRLQVEHPVTEETSGIDLVVEQLRIADGLPLSVLTAPVPRGHSIEFRINAEDVGRGFLPTPGQITALQLPSGPGVRVDSGVEVGSIVSGAFDSLLAKLVVTGSTRSQALARAQRALAEFHIDGVPTVLPFHRAVVEHPDFTNADALSVHTRWIETDFNASPAASPCPDLPPDKAFARFAIELDGKRVNIGLPPALLQSFVMNPAATAGDRGSAEAQQPSERGEILTAPMSGTLVAWKVANGATVALDDVVAVMEAMKMETQILAHRPGRIGYSEALTGSYIASGHTLATIE